MNTKPRRGLAAVNDIEIAYRLYGGGYPLLKIAGFGSTMRTADLQFIQALGERYTVITYDSRGMGQTCPGKAKPSISQYARDAAGLLESLGAKRAHVLGVSMGGCVAQELALEFPRKVDNLVLVNTWGGSLPIAPKVMSALSDLSGTPRLRAERLVSLLFPAEWLKEHRGEMVKKFTVSGPAPAFYDLAGQEAAIRDWEGDLDRLACIRKWLLVISGSLDEVVPPRESDLIADRVPGALHYRVDGGGHGVTHQFPMECARAVLNFLP